MYKNYNDGGMPADKDDTYTPPQDKYCFRLTIIVEASRYGGDSLDGGTYTGWFGSTALARKNFQKPAHDEGLHKSPSDFVLKSASGRPGDVKIAVDVEDKANITDLVLPDRNSPYTRQPGLSGSYSIIQWVNFVSFERSDSSFFGGQGHFEQIELRCGIEEGFYPTINPHKERLIMVFVPTVTFACPDWLERRVAEVLNQFEEVLPYVRKIGFSGGDLGEAGIFTEHYPGFIFLNPLDAAGMRWNLPSMNGYGFLEQNSIDSVTRHEAFHSFYYHTVVGRGREGQGPFITDKDNDGLPKENAGGMFRYVWDNAANPFGPCGADDTNAVPKGNDGYYTYKGDDKSDLNFNDAWHDNWIKRFLIREDTYDKANIKFLIADPVTGKIVSSNKKVYSLVANNPIKKITMEKIFIVLTKGYSKVYLFLSDKDYSYTEIPHKQNTTQPELRVVLNVGDGRKNIIKRLQGEGYEVGALYIAYRIFTPFLQEGDACLAAKNVYIGYQGQ
ncbi:MAG: hypothetical protein NT033_02450 [Candidatus Omnitrophica bacterium]|nr:hypothetical protein [Candidatus Omnitrophota bacterium]